MQAKYVLFFHIFNNINKEDDFKVRHTIIIHHPSYVRMGDM